MTTRPIVSTNLNRKESRSVKSSSLIVTVVSVYILFYYTQPYAASWTVNSFVQAQEIYSDNIKLAPSGREQSAFVTEVNPGVSINANSPLSTWNFILSNAEFI